MSKVKKIVSIGKNSKHLAILELENGTRQRITYKSLRQYWEYARYRDIECINYSLEDEYVTIWATVACGQGGVIAVWDSKKENWCHIQEGSYTLCSILLKEIETIVAFHYVSNYAVAGHHIITATGLGVLDSGASLGTVLLPVEWQNRRFNFKDYDIDQMACESNADEEIVNKCGLLGLFYSKKRNMLYAHDACNYADINVDEIKAYVNAKKRECIENSNQNKH